MSLKLREDGTVEEFSYSDSGSPVEVLSEVGVHFMLPLLFYLIKITKCLHIPNQTDKFPVITFNSISFIIPPEVI